jgi:protein SCO1
MKTKLSLFICSVAVANFSHGADAPQPACCAEEKPVVATCCAALNPSAPLTAKSLYQLDATWTNDAGQNVRLGAFRGRPVVIAMFFAQCEYACPMLVGDLQRLRDSLPAEVRKKTQFVLVSFDTARDTPAVLKTYREKRALDPSWALLRGDTGGVQELAMLLGVKFKEDARGQFAHSNLFTVLNAEGEIAHQKNGLMGDVSEAAKVVGQLSR